MKLYETMFEPCIMIDKTTVSDGMGGFTYAWRDGAEFQAAIVKDNSLGARIAEKQGVSEVYTVTVPRGIILEYHTVFRRVKDGAIFRVTTNIVDSETPDVATFQFGQVNAERWELT